MNMNTNKMELNLEEPEKSAEASGTSKPSPWRNAQSMK
jgi:hypothetical protein